MIKYSVAFWALRKYLRRLTQRRRIIRIGGNEWERKWQVAGKCCNINRTDPYAGEDQTVPSMIHTDFNISLYIPIYLATWSGVVTNILSLTLRLKFSLGILFVANVTVSEVSAFTARDILGESLPICYISSS